MSKHPSQVDAASLLAEEKERRLAEERAIAALKLQRKQRLQAMTIKRQRNLDYLKKVHQGGCYWLNAVLLTSADIHHHIGRAVSKSRVDSFFSLGISVSKIIKLNSGLPIVRAFSQLMEEWEYVHAGATMQSVKFVMAKNSPCIYPQMSPIEGFSDLSRPSVYKFNNAVVFEHLQLPHIPYELDYAEVFVGLCAELSKLYEKLVHEECYSNQVLYDAIVRLDTRVKHHIINMAAKEITEACARKVKAGTKGLRALAGVNFLGAGAGTGTSSALPKAGSNVSLSSAGQRNTGNQSPSQPASSTVSAGIAAGGDGPDRKSRKADGSAGEADGATTEAVPVVVDNPVIARNRKTSSSQAAAES